MYRNDASAQKWSLRSTMKLCTDTCIKLGGEDGKPQLDQLDPADAFHQRCLLATATSTGNNPWGPYPPFQLPKMKGLRALHTVGL